jgi:mRNA interferase MazF
MTVLPDRGDLVWVNFTPQSGNEQAGHRPALVVSPKIYHKKSKFTLVCPITSNITFWPWKVILPEDAVVQGAILVDQLRSIDRVARKPAIIGKVSQDIMDEVVAKIAVLTGCEV